MAASKTFWAYFDFPDTIRINTAQAYIYNVVQTPGAGAEPVTTIKLKSDQFVDKDNLAGYGLTINEDQFSEYYYFVATITSYYDSKGELKNVDPWVFNVMAVLTHNDTNFYIGPQSTVASVYAFAQRIRIGGGNWQKIVGSRDFVEVAYAMMNNLYVTGAKVSQVVSSAPNAMQTNSYAVYNFLSTLLFYSLVNPDIRLNFLKCVNSIPGVKVDNTLDAIIAVAQNPFNNVKCIYDLINEEPDIYKPSLRQIAEAGFEPMPNQWTLAVKINQSGSGNFLIAGTAYTVFDKDNKAWVTNNFRAGTPNSGGHCMVFNPDGSPADISPIVGGGILGPGFGIAVNPTGDTIAIGNYGWGSKDYNPVAGSMSVFSSDGAVKSPPGGNVKGLCRVQGMCYDPDGNLWMASWGTQAPMEDPDGPHVYDTPSQPSAVVCYVDGDPDKALVYNEFEGGKSEWHGTFDVVIDHDGNCLVSNAGTAKKMASSVYKVRLSANKDAIEYVAHWPGDWQNGNPAGFEELRQVQVDGDGYIYAGGITSCRVVKLQAVKKDGIEKLEKVAEYFDNVYGPWGITIDAKGKKFLTGFGGKKQAEIIDGKINPEREFAITVVEADDQDWSRTKLMTLPTGGEEVRLANGQPLYGNQTLPEYLPKSGSKVPDDYKVLIESLKGVKMPACYSPLMRTTATSVDRAGNLWCANNWKPSLFSDVWANTPNANPGGDGLVIFVGVAEPLAGIND